MWKPTTAPRFPSILTESIFLGAIRESEAASSGSDAGRHVCTTLSPTATTFMRIVVASESSTSETQRTNLRKLFENARKEFYYNSLPVVSVFFFISVSLLKYYFTTACSMQTHVWGFLIFDRRSFSQLSFTLLWVLLLLLLPGHLNICVHLKIDGSNENPPGGKEWGYGQICVFRQGQHIFDNCC